MAVLIKLPVYKDLFTLDPDRVSGESDDPLDEILAFVHRIDENDHIPSAWFTDGDQGGTDKRDLDPVDKLVDEDVISYQQGRLHGARRDLKSLNDKRSNKQGQQNGNRCSLCILPKGALLLDRFLAFDFLQMILPFESINQKSPKAQDHNMTKMSKPPGSQRKRSGALYLKGNNLILNMGICKGVFADTTSGINFLYCTLYAYKLCKI